MKRFDKSKYKDLEFCGYRWIGFDNGIHSFQKREGKGYGCIECEEKQLFNGDIQFMAFHNLTLSNERIKKAKQRYVKNNAE